MFSYGPFHTDMQMLDDQREIIYNSSVQAQDGVKKTWQKQWMIEINDERESGKSVLAVWYDDNFSSRTT